MVNGFTGLFGCNLRVKTRDIKDGVSKTILLGESYFNKREGWAMGCRGGTTNKPPYSSWDPASAVTGSTVYLDGCVALYHGINTTIATSGNTVALQSLHPGGVHVALGDGAVTFMNEDIEFRTYLSLGSRNGGEPADIP
jgi:hypothetical protein